ncbi:MAG: disulfide bond formation protein B [Rhodobacteraceae bacterium]|nr:disulfide bond formation protein B [Paracoccaceae bacterium]
MNALQRAGAGAAAGSAALLAAALAFQYLGGLAPCPLCIWQRWPHVAAVLLGLALLATPRREIAALGALAMLAGAGIAAYHAGVEQGWWPGPVTCTAPDVADLTPDELLAQILTTPVVRCDEIAWSLFGVSMAGWNALACLALTGIWLRAYASSSASQ